MKLDATLLKHLSSTEFRVLVSIEMGMKNHEWVPIPLIESIAKLRHGGIRSHFSRLLQHKLIVHNGQQYEGYKLTYLGYDFLALKTFSKRGSVVAVGQRIGVGKEADVHICQQHDGKLVCIKFHRLGRRSFRTVKKNRDYHQHRQYASWMYLSRLAALKEYACMKALHENAFPVPTPIDVNRHAIVMSFVEGTLLSQVQTLNHPYNVLESLMRLLVRLARCGVIHGDFNEFNLVISDAEEVTMIDFPQIVSIHHLNGKDYFERDVNCIKTFFKKRFSIDVLEAPQFDEVMLNSGEETNEAFKTNIRHSLLNDEEEGALMEAYETGSNLEETWVEEEEVNENVELNSIGVDSTTDVVFETIESSSDIETTEKSEKSEKSESESPTDSVLSSEDDNEKGTSGHYIEVTNISKRRHQVAAIRRRVRRNQKKPQKSKGNYGENKSATKRKLKEQTKFD